MSQQGQWQLCTFAESGTGGRYSDMTIDELEQEISAVPRFGTGGGLDNLRKYLDILGRPEENLKVIHVAGTNGKGSVCAFL